VIAARVAKNAVGGTANAKGGYETYGHAVKMTSGGKCKHLAEPKDKALGFGWPTILSRSRRGN
jgi:hypothetical protein